jgi:hypothetical protein
MDGPGMWQPFLLLALLVAALRWLTRRRAPAGPTEPLPDVGDAPLDAEPIIRPRLDDNGLATYTMVIPREGEGRGEGEKRDR